MEDDAVPNWSNELTKTEIALLIVVVTFLIPAIKQPTGLEDPGDAVAKVI